MLEQSLAETAPLPVLEHIEGFVKGRVSIILPAFNEQANIVSTISRVKKQFGDVCPDFEIIVVDDGSHDETWRAVESLEERNVQLIGYPGNQGKGYALKKGLYQATGEFAFMMDSDSEIWPRELKAYLRALQSSDIVIGSKRHPLSVVRTPAMRKFLSLAFNISERLLTGVRATDTQAGLKAARTSALYRILPILAVKRYAFDVELLAVATLLGYRIKELPVDIDLKGRFSLGQVMRMLLDLAGIAYRLRIRRWYQENFVVMKSTYRPIITIERNNNGPS